MSATILPSIVDGRRERATVSELTGARQRTSDEVQRTAVFQVRGLTKIYGMGEVEVHALRQVDLDLYAGEFLVLLGASGDKVDDGSRVR